MYTINLSLIKNTAATIYNNVKSLAPSARSLLMFATFCNQITKTAAQNNTGDNSTIWESPEFIGPVAGGGALLLLCSAGLCATVVFKKTCRTHFVPYEAIPGSVPEQIPNQNSSRITNDESQSLTSIEGSTSTTS